MKPILVTLGDPNGLGPELACRLLGDHNHAQQLPVPLVLVGPENALAYHCDRMGIRPFWRRIDNTNEFPAGEAAEGIFLYEPQQLQQVDLTVGQPTPEGGRSAGVSLDAACKLIASGFADGMVTLPLHKAMLQDAGFDFPGHTEFLARFSGLRDEDVCMHLCGDKLRVSLVTTHPPLSEVPKLVTRERILHCLSLTAEFARALGVGNLPVAVCGLNPHAGESGKIGTEDQFVVEPAVQEAIDAGINASGPYPADTVFYRAAQGEFSAVLAMYHDQGLGPLKLLHFSRAVNVTLGLPFVRTSVDHGTGFDIAGKDIADTGSFEEALKLAMKLIEGREPCA